MCSFLFICVSSLFHFQSFIFAHLFRAVLSKYIGMNLLINPTTTVPQREPHISNNLTEESDISHQYSTTLMSKHLCEKERSLSSLSLLLPRPKCFGFPRCQGHVCQFFSDVFFLGGMKTVISILCPRHFIPWLFEEKKCLK